MAGNTEQGKTNPQGEDVPINLDLGGLEGEPHSGPEVRNARPPQTNQPLIF